MQKQKSAGRLITRLRLEHLTLRDSIPTVSEGDGVLGTVAQFGSGANTPCRDGFNLSYSSEQLV